MVSPTLILTEGYHFQLNYLDLFRKGFFNILEIWKVVGIMDVGNFSMWPVSHKGGLYIILEGLNLG
jgi:hypothetical protein